LRRNGEKITDDTWILSRRNRKTLTGTVGSLCGFIQV